jgi:hypothetical protein
LNALPGTGIHVADQSTVSRGKLIELVDPVLDGLNMPPYIPFARKRMKDERSEARLIAFPEVLAGGL